MSSLAHNRNSDQCQCEALAPPKWKPLTAAERAQIGLTPNHAYYADGRRVVIVVRQSGSGDGFALSKGGVDHFKPLLSGQRITACAVRLVGRDGSVVGELGLEALAPVLEAATVNASINYGGGYWWLDRDFNVSPIGARSEASPGWLQLPDEPQGEM